MWRLRALLAAAVVAFATISPVPNMRAGGLPAPVPLSPVGGTAADVSVTFSWERVEGAAGYRLRVRHATEDGTIHVDAETVNDTYIALVNFSGDTAWWEVAALNASGDEGDWARASFTTAAIAPTLVWPPDGSTVNHPDSWPDLEVGWVPGQPEGIFAELGETEEPGNPPSRFGLGTWSWQVRSTRGPGDPISPSPSSEVRTFTYAWPGGTPTLLSPPNAYVLGVTEALRLRWAPVPGAAMYHWELNRDGQTYKFYTETRAPWADVRSDGSPGDLPPGTYEWRVRAVLAGTVQFPVAWFPQFGPWSASRTVTIPGSPVTPTLTSPADGAALSSWPVLRWDPVPGASGYSIQVSDAPDDETDPAAPGSGVNAFSFRAAGDPAFPDPMYQATPGSVTRHWRVRAFGAEYGTDGGAWSDWRSFEVAPVGPALPDETPATRLGPADCTSDECPDLDGLPLLRWEPVAGAASYRVFIRWDGGTGGTNTSYDVGSVGFPLPTYEPATSTSRVAWAVRACPEEGCSTSMPAGRSHFRVSFAAPEQTGPADGTVQGRSTVEMSWVEPESPEHPDALQRRLESQIQIMVTPGEFGPTDLWGNFVDQPLYTMEGIRDGQSVAWRVRMSMRIDVLESVGGTWSPWRTITRDEPAIDLVSPADGATLDATPVLDWAGLPYEADGYEYELVKMSTLQELIAQHPQNEELYADIRAVIGATSARVPQLAPGEYRWRVRRNGSGLPNRERDGAWTTRFFTIAGEGAPQPLTPAAGATVQADDGVLTWNSVAIAADSDNPCAVSAGLNEVDQVVEVAAAPAFSGDSLVYRGCVGRWTASHPVPELLPTGDLYWRICAAFDCSAPRLVHVTAASNPDVVPPTTSKVKVLPTTGSTLTTAGAIPVTISWSASDLGTGIASQGLQVRRGSGSWTSVPVTPTARSATTIMEPGATYSVRVRAVDLAGNVGQWTTKTLDTRLRQESAAAWSWSGPWKRAEKSSASGGATRFTSTAGATATMRTSASAFALVAPRSSSKGNIRIYVDGVFVATVKLDSSPTGPRRIVWATRWANEGVHRVTIRVSGTAGHPRVDLDALVILR